MYAIILPVVALPSWDRVTISLTHFTIPAGTASSWDATSGACCPGPKLKAIVAGTLTVVSEGPVRVVRATAPDRIEPFPAGREVVLTAGDTVITRNEHGDTWTNPGPEPVELLSTPVLSGNVPGPPVPRGWIMGGADVRQGMSLSAEAYLLRLRRMTVMTGDVVRVPPAALLFAQTLASEPVYLARGIAGQISVFGAQDTTVALYLLTVDPVGAGAGTPLAAAAGT